jgi:hypothetical protein
VAEETVTKEAETVTKEAETVTKAEETAKEAAETVTKEATKENAAVAGGAEGEASAVSGTPPPSFPQEGSFVGGRNQKDWCVSPPLKVETQQLPNSATGRR